MEADINFHTVSMALTPIIIGILLGSLIIYYTAPTSNKNDLYFSSQTIQLRHLSGFTLEDLNHMKLFEEISLSKPLKINKWFSNYYTSITRVPVGFILTRSNSEKTSTVSCFIPWTHSNN